MPSLPGRPSSAEHQAAVTRRLELLRAELAGAPGPTYAAVPGHEPPYDPAADDADPWWSSATRVPGARPGLLGAAAPARLLPPPTPHLVAAVAPADEPETPPHVFGAAPWVPVPGRHASRRDRPSPGWLPDTLKGRVTLGSTQLTVVAVLVAVGLGVTAWSVVRSAPEPVLAAPGATASASVSGSDSGTAPDGQLVELPDGAAASGGPGLVAVPAGGEVAAAAAPGLVPAPGSATGEVTVDVAGKVRRPGIAVLPSGARVVDALEAAGGARGGVDLTSLNLARVLVDGEQLLVGVPAPPGAAASVLAAGGTAAQAGATSPPGALVNLNTATEADLDTLPDVGPVTAQSIIAWRAEHGGFTGVDELLEVDGIGEATLSRLAPLVTV